MNKWFWRKTVCTLPTLPKLTDKKMCWCICAIAVTTQTFIEFVSKQASKHIYPKIKWKKLLDAVVFCDDKDSTAHQLRSILLPSRNLSSYNFIFSFSFSFIESRNNYRFLSFKTEWELKSWSKKWRLKNKKLNENVHSLFTF